jgi:hypothetical protein
MPTNKDWGPFLWTALHGFAEKLGKQSVEIMASDEAREMVLVLRGVEHIMPCEKCRKHYHDYLKKNPVDEFAHRRGEVLRQAARVWLWKLHEAVNERNGAPSFPIEDLTPTYQNAAIADSLKELYVVLMRSIPAGLLLSEPVKSFRRHVSLLRSLLGV